MYRSAAALALAALLSACQTVQSPVKPDVAVSIPEGQTLVFGTYEVEINGHSMLPYAPYSIASCDRTTIVYLLQSANADDLADSECTLHDQIVYLLNLTTEEVFVQSVGGGGQFFFLVPHGVYALIGSGTGQDPWHDPRYGAGGFLFSTEQDRIVYVGTRRLSVGTAEYPVNYEQLVRGYRKALVQSIQDRAEGSRILAAQYPDLAPVDFTMPTIHKALIPVKPSFWWGMTNPLPNYIDEAREDATWMGLLAPTP